MNFELFRALPARETTDSSACHTSEKPCLLETKRQKGTWNAFARDSLWFSINQCSNNINVLVLCPSLYIHGIAKESNPCSHLWIFVLCSTKLWHSTVFARHQRVEGLLPLGYAKANNIIYVTFKKIATSCCYQRSVTANNALQHMSKAGNVWWQLQFLEIIFANSH